MVNTCAVVYENDTDFGQLNVIPSTLSQPSTVVLPSEKIDPAAVSQSGVSTTHSDISRECQESVRCVDYTP